MKPSIPSAPPSPAAAPSNFVRDIILEDLQTNKYQGRVHTRFPPEPNGYLHIGHAKSICLNFGLAAEFGGKTNLRFDDTNPCKEETEYVDSIIENVHWLGFDWEDRLFYASDYFGQLYQWAVQLIQTGKAYVCDLTADEIRQYRGTPTEPGKESPYRNRSIEENLDLFTRMRAGEFAAGASPRCTTTPTGRAIPWKASPTPSAPWSSKITARSTIGTSKPSASIIRSRSSSTA